MFLGVKQMSRFKANDFNFVPCALKAVDSIKGRGVIAQRRIQKGEIIALFPGVQTFRIPSEGVLPMERWETRREADQVLINESQEYLPVSDYSIVTAVLDWEDRSQPPVGYHYRVLEPLADEQAHSVDMKRLLDTFESSKSFEEPPVPPEMVPLINHKVEQLYARLMEGGIRILTPPSVPSDPKSFEFFLDTRGGERMIVIHLPSGDFFSLCATSLGRNEEHVKGRIHEAIMSVFDMKRKLHLFMRDQARTIKLPDDYVFMAPFINQPYSHERANCEFVDPDEWIPELLAMRASDSPHLARLIRAAREEPTTPAVRGYVQRQVIIATRDIAGGEELLLHYSRDGDGE